MVKKISIIIGFSILLTFVSPIVEADDFDFKVTADYFTKYIWRGQNVSDRSVFQPTISLYRNGFTGSFWGNMDLTGQNEHRWEFIELNFVLDYTASLPDMNGVNFSFGTIHYQFPNTSSKPTTEVYTGLSFDWPLTPYIRWYRDVDEVDGSYFQFGIGHSIDKIYTFTDKCFCGLQLGASTAWGSSSYNDAYFGVDSGKFNDLMLSVGFPVCIDSWTIRPNVNYSMMLSDSIRAATDESDNLWVGVGVSTTF